jgi:hypothetical protein
MNLLKLNTELPSLNSSYSSTSFYLNNSHIIARDFGGFSKFVFVLPIKKSEQTVRTCDTPRFNPPLKKFLLELPFSFPFFEFIEERVERNRKV